MTVEVQVEAWTDDYGLEILVEEIREIDSAPSAPLGRASNVRPSEGGAVVARLLRAVADDRPGDRVRVVGCQDHAHPSRGMTPRLWSRVWLAVEQFEVWQQERRAADSVARGDVTG